MKKNTHNVKVSDMAHPNGSGSGNKRLCNLLQATILHLPKTWKDKTPNAQERKNKKQKQKQKQEREKLKPRVASREALDLRSLDGPNSVVVSAHSKNLGLLIQSFQPLFTGPIDFLLENSLHVLLEDSCSS